MSDNPTVDAYERIISAHLAILHDLIAVDDDRGRVATNRSWNETILVLRDMIHTRRKVLTPVGQPVVMDQYSVDVMQEYDELSDALAVDRARRKREYTRSIDIPMTTQGYSVTMTTDEGGTTTVLTKRSDGRTKTFFQAGKPTDGVVASLVGHMLTLTDENCDGFFPAERKKKEKPAKA